MDSYGNEIYGRSRLLLGEDVVSAMARTRVIIFGVGGVGSWCAEGLLRSGITDLTLVDPDTVSVTNVNRQLMATSQTVGQVKVEALRERLLEIDPQAKITAVRKAYCEETAGEFDLDGYDYVIDAVDSLKHKTLLILNASASKAKFFCSLGAALKVDPRRIKVSEFWSVRGCPLGAAIRKRMKKAGTLPSSSFLCVYDDEVLPNRGPADTSAEEEVSFHKAQVNGSLVHITAMFGMTLAGLVVEDIYESVVK